MLNAVYFFYWAPAVPWNPWIPLAEPWGSVEPRLKNAGVHNSAYWKVCRVVQKVAQWNNGYNWCSVTKVIAKLKPGYCFLDHLVCDLSSEHVKEKAATKLYVCCVIAVISGIHVVLYKHEVRPVPNVAQLPARFSSTLTYLLRIVAMLLCWELCDCERVMVNTVKHIFAVS